MGAVFHTKTNQQVKNINVVKICHRWRYDQNYQDCITDSTSLTHLYYLKNESVITRNMETLTKGGWTETETETELL